MDRVVITRLLSGLFAGEHDITSVFTYAPDLQGHQRRFSPDDRFLRMPYDIRKSLPDVGIGTMEDAVSGMQETDHLLLLPAMPHIGVPRAPGTMQWSLRALF